ncbi:MAG: hypothetical protein KDB79_14635 [Acidobacteria bacterium]|nr:hypothetical protein [Acidobacteriota bacterium]
MKNFIKLGFTIGFLLTISAGLFAQNNKPESIFVDQYEEGDEFDSKILDLKIKRVAAILERIPRSVSVEIIFQRELGEIDCWTEKKTTAEIRAEYVRNELIEKYGIQEERVTIEHAGYDRDTWLIFRLFANSRELLSGINKEEVINIDPYQGYVVDCFCPDIRIKGPSSVTSSVFEGKMVKPARIEFVSYFDVPAASRFFWQITGGKIISGQGTPRLLVEVGHDKEVTARVKISGITGVSSDLESICSMESDKFVTEVISN